jgi:glycosyltransferase involved in cell wall biosynthesis
VRIIKLRLLIAYGSKGKFFHLKEFGEALKKLGNEYRIIKDTDYCRGFPSKNILDWFPNKQKFQKLIKDFSPDAVFVDRQTHFGLEVLRSKIPLFVLLRGHYWSEIEYGKETLYKKNPIMHIVINLRKQIAEKCFKNATAVLPICTYLEKIVKEHYPDQSTYVFFEGIDSSRWFPTKGMNLKHPCIGLLQDANWWGKTKEMLILRKVLPKMPHVTFYWAGDGPYRDKVLSELNKFENFKWLGRLDYPNKVRDFLSDIDVYALISGMDLAPLTLKEAQLMKKSVIATNVGGNYEMMENGKTGFLVEEGNHDMLIEKLSLLLTDKTLAQNMGFAGRSFVEETFSWEKIAKNFLKMTESHIKI